MIAEIKAFCEQDEFSRPAANKTVKVRPPSGGEKVPVAVRYWNFTKVHVYTQYKARHPARNIAASTFYSVLKKHLPHMKKLQTEDGCVCPICCEHPKLKKMVDTLIQQVHSGCGATPACLKGTCNVREPDDLRQARERLEAAETHKQHLESQKASFEQQKRELEPGKGLLVIDFKASVMLEHALIEDANLFYEKTPRSYFSCTVYYKNRDTQRLCTRFFDFVSDDPNKSTWWTICALNQVWKHPQFIELGIETMSLWMDNGPAHFRTREFLMYLYDTAGPEGKLKWDYFTEYHGKSICDTHFSKVLVVSDQCISILISCFTTLKSHIHSLIMQVTAAINTWSHTPGQEITNTDELVAGIQQQFARWREQAAAVQPKRSRKGLEVNDGEDRMSFYDIHVSKLAVSPYPSVKRILAITSKPTFQSYFSFARSGEDLLAGITSQRRSRVDIEIKEEAYKAGARQAKDTPIRGMAKLSRKAQNVHVARRNEFDHLEQEVCVVSVCILNSDVVLE